MSGEHLQDHWSSVFFPGERLKAGNEDLAMVVNAGEAGVRRLNNEEDEDD